jgi:hypothetical protein
VIGVRNWFMREKCPAERAVPCAYAALGFSSTSATP